MTSRLRVYLSLDILCVFNLYFSYRMSKTEADTRYFDSLNAVTPQNKEEYVRKIESVKPEKLRVFKVICEI